MRVNFVQQQVDGSFFYRMKLPCETLRNQGLDARVVLTGVDVRDADVWVMNRPISQKAVQVIQELEESGRKVVVDIDDNFGAVRPAHSMFATAAEAHANTLLACKEASLVICTTQTLLDEYGSGHGVVIPNYIPESYLSIERRGHSGGAWVGWSGTRTSHPGNLEETRGQVAKAVRDGDAEFAYVGPKELAWEIKEALGKCRLKTSGWFRIQDYPKAIAELDIGIIPLCNTTFDHSKSWLKLAEYASVGVAGVASPSQPNKLLNSYGVGLIAERPKDWYRQISKLIKDADYREDIAETSREVMHLFTVEKNCNQWVDAFNRALRSDR